MSLILDRLENLYRTREDEVERWLSRRRAERAPYVYNSVDLRHSGRRLVPVDTNLFPAGFNNLSPAAESRAARCLARYFAERFPAAARVLIVPENHTRNLAYLDNLAALLRIARAAGLEAQVGSLLPAAAQPPGEAVERKPLRRDGPLLLTEDGFAPDAVLLNNDCTAGVPELLQGIAQPIVPPPALGWHARRKSVHFAAYRALAESFGAEFGLDPWLIAADFRQCGRIDFKQRNGLDCLAKAVDDILAAAAKKHAEHGIAEAPYAFVKADGGTYGMGIMNVRSGSEIIEMNKKERNKMQVVKEGMRVSEVIVQEGIPTAESIGGKPAEPMIYLIDGIPAGGMYRVNGARDAFGNLNAAGVEFTGMCDETETSSGERRPVRACHFRPYGLIAALAALAVPREEY